MSNVLNINNIDNNNIIFTDPIKINDKILHVPIKYKDRGKKNFLLQTPKMYLPFGISSFDKNKYVNYSFRDVDINKEVKTFYNILSDIINIVKKKAKEWDIFIGRKRYKKNLKINGNYPALLSTKIDYVENEYNIKIYDNHRNKIEIEDVEKNKYGIGIIEISHVWVMEHRIYSIQIKTLQLKIFIPDILDSYAFIDDVSESVKENLIEYKKKEEIKKEGIKLKDHIKYKEYFKLVNLGVPIIAVENKMKTDKCSEEEIELLKMDKDDYVPEKFVDTKKKTNTIVNSNMINNISLKKTEEVKRGKIEKKGLDISLDEIIQKFKSLRETENSKKLYKSNVKDILKKEDKKEKNEKKDKKGLLSGMLNIRASLFSQIRKVNE
tara:strand:- start:2501 stop:3640 length:1140 start_codon:yes stop_codon:yes gene_type:complete